MIHKKATKSFFLIQLSLTIGFVTSHSFNCSQPPNFSNFDVNACCRIPEINLGTAPQKCDEYIASIKKVHDEYPAYTHVCYPECIYRETGSLVDGGEIAIDKVKNFLESNVNSRDKDIVPHILRSFEVCLENIKLHMTEANVTMYPKLPEGCSVYSSMVYGCVNAETFLHCPAKMWRHERHCNLAKNFASQCNPLPHVPLPI